MTAPRYSVTVRMDAEDFEHLSVTMSDRPNFGLDRFPDRFFDMTAGEFPPDLGRWAYAYWYDSYTDLIMARSFLEANGEPFQVTSDEYIDEAETAHGVIHHTHGPGWVIFTDYAGPYWAKRQEKAQEA